MGGIACKYLSIGCPYAKYITFEKTNNTMRFAGISVLNIKGEEIANDAITTKEGDIIILGWKKSQQIQKIAFTSANNTDPTVFKGGTLNLRSPNGDLIAAHALGDERVQSYVFVDPSK